MFIATYVLRWIFYLDHIVEKQYGIDKKMEFMNMIEEG